MTPTTVRKRCICPALGNSGPQRCRSELRERSIELTCLVPCGTVHLRCQRLGAKSAGCITRHSFPARGLLRRKNRADAHILIAFLAYCLQVTLKQRLLLHAPGLTPTAVLEKLADIKMIEVWIPTVDQRWWILPRYAQPLSTRNCSSIN